MMKPYGSLTLITINSNILAVDDNNEQNESLDESISSIERFYKKNKNWTHQYVEFNERKKYWVSSFMSRLVIIGGYIEDNDF